MYERNVEARSHNHFCRGKAISITYSEYVSVALVIQDAKRMRRIILPPWSVWFYYIFPHYLISGTIFGEKFIAHKMCILIFYKNFVRNISHSKKN